MWHHVAGTVTSGRDGGGAPVAFPTGTGGKRGGGGGGGPFFFVIRLGAIVIAQFASSIARLRKPFDARGKPTIVPPVLSELYAGMRW